MEKLIKLIEALYAKASPYIFTMRFLVVGAGVVLFSSLFFFAGLEYFTTNRPEFCLTCHYRQAFTDFKVKSLVHPKMNCTECHADHTKFQLVTAGYSSRRERVDPNCMRCHKDITSKDPASFKKNVMKITIPHKLHIEDVGASCNDCHSNVYHDKMTPATNRPRMDFCFNCHSWENTTCTKCHPKGTVEMPKAQHTSPSICKQCHPGFETKKITIFKRDYPHQKHIHSGIICDTCHNNREQHGKIAITNDDCNKCHAKKKS